MAGAATAMMMQGLIVPLSFVSAFTLGSLAPMAGIVGLYVPYAIWGVFQLFYIVPAIIYARSRGKVEYASGICAGATLVCILHWAFLISIQPVSWE